MTIETKMLLWNAINNPQSYSKGAERRKLQVAVDFMLNAVSEKFLNRPNTGWMDLRARLNKLDASCLSDEDKMTLGSMGELLKVRELLHSKQYSDHDGNVTTFCSDYLSVAFSNFTA